MEQEHAESEGRERHAARRTWIGWCLRLLKRGLLVVLLLIVLYVAIVLVGLIPVNNGFEPAENGITVTVISSPVHADIVLPLHNKVIDWQKEFPAECFERDVSTATHVAIGWGDRGFFLETPTWADLKVRTAASALLLPSDTCLHVSMLHGEFAGDGVRSVQITQQQYEALVAFMSKSFRRDTDGRAVQITGYAYGTNDAFFEARGSYNCINTCNAWVGRAMKSAGVRTPWLTPLPKTVFMYLPE